MNTIIHIHEDFQSPEWQELMETIPQQMAASPRSESLRNGRNHVCRITLGDTALVAKRFFNKGPWKKLVYRVASGKARRSFDNSLALLQAGLKTPRPMAWREDWQWGGLKESFYVCAHLDVAQTARAVGRDPTIDWIPQVCKIAKSVARMHDAGMVHLDLTAGNILFSGPRPEDWKVCFIDNNRMRFGQVGLRRGVQSLVQSKIQGPCQAPCVGAYAEARGFDPGVCQKLYNQFMERHKRKWWIKNQTRPWRRKIGL